MTIKRFYTSPAISEHKHKYILDKLKIISDAVVKLNTERCYHVELKHGVDDLSPEKCRVLKWLLSSTVNLDKLTDASKLKEKSHNIQVIECGPR